MPVEEDVSEGGGRTHQEDLGGLLTTKNSVLENSKCKSLVWGESLVIICK